jgi:hypothetical protein
MSGLTNTGRDSAEAPRGYAVAPCGRAAKPLGHVAGALSLGLPAAAEDRRQAQPLTSGVIDIPVHRATPVVRKWNREGLDLIAAGETLLQQA